MTVLQGKQIFVRETNGLVVKYLETVHLPSNCEFFSDNDNAFTPKSEIIWDDWVGTRIDTYSASVRHCISPNDYHLYGNSKTKWKSKQGEMGVGS